MEIRFILQTILEVAIAGFIIYGLFFEEGFVEAERKAFKFIKRKLRQTFSSNKQTQMN